MSNNEADEDICSMCERSPCLGLQWKAYLSDHVEVLKTFVQEYWTFDVNANFCIRDALPHLSNLTRSLLRKTLCRLWHDSGIEVRGSTRERIALCIEVEIRKMFPSTDGVYKGFTFVNNKKVVAVDIANRPLTNLFWLKRCRKWELVDNKNRFIRY